MTLFGIIWIFTMGFLLFKPTQYLICALIFSSIFQATSVINFDGKGIQPFFFTELFIILKFISFKQNFKHLRINSTSRLLFLFLFLCLISAAFFPEVFRGMEVYPGNLGIDDNVTFGGSHLTYSNSNLIQSIFITVHVITFYIIYQKSNVIDPQVIWKTLIFMVCFFIFIGILQYLSFNFPSVPYPSSFLYNNDISESTQILTGSDLGINRISATFTEPSFAGAFIGALFWAFFPQKGLKFRCITFLLFICLLFNLSSTGIVTFLAGALVYTFLFRRRMLLWIFLGISIAYYIIIKIPSLNFILNGILFDKLNSGSGINRTSADIFSWNLFLDTYGLGVGLGSHRTSSFLFNMLSNVGLFGTIIWFVFMVKILKPLFKLMDKPIALFVLVFSLVLFCGQLTGISELNLGILWMWIFLAVILKDKYLNSQNQDYATI